MFCGGKGEHRPDVTLAMCHRLDNTPSYRLNNVIPYFFYKFGQKKYYYFKCPK